MERLHKTLFWTVILSETTHVFCCGLPIVISVVGLLAGMGLMSVLPPGIVAFHEMMHDYEKPLIVMSAVVLALGWGLQYLSRRLDCHDTGCVHGPCSPAKRKSSLVLKIATALFLLNISGYFLFHAG